jgi:hypothetical protein
MVRCRCLLHGRFWLPGGGTGVLLTLCLMLGGWMGGAEAAADSMNVGAQTSQPRISVQHGLLSVRLWNADVREVMAEIGQAAGVPVILGPIAERRVSTEFGGVELAAGLQRLLKLAALNHTILYAKGPAGRMQITKVLVFGTEQGSSSDDRQPPPAPAIADRDAPLPKDDAASAVVSHIQEAMERYRLQPRQPLEGQESKIVRPVQSAIEQAIQRQGPSPSQPLSAADVIALTPRTLRGYHPFASDQVGPEAPRHLDEGAANDPHTP